MLLLFERYIYIRKVEVCRIELNFEGTMIDFNVFLRDLRLRNRIQRAVLNGG